MATALRKLPRCRPELYFGPQNDQHKFVLKNRRTDEYYQIGAVERFLLSQLDGERDAETICTNFETEFGEALTTTDLDHFLGLAAQQDWLELTNVVPAVANPAVSTPNECEPAATPNGSAPEPSRRARQSVLAWRISLFDPDRLFDWAEPRIRFFWTRGFLLLSACSILSALLVVWANRGDILNEFVNSFHWQTLLLAIVAIGAITLCHEFAHGLTCKHYGGEVHEVGFLLLFLMPCFFCNVSDAWLLPRKSQRLSVTMAGGYFELFLWSLAVFIWRLTLIDSALNFMAWVVLSLSGIRVLMNFNPLIPLDGYYLLGDAVEIPNLRPRAIGYLHAWLRCRLWGGPRPAVNPRGRFLLWYGAASWLFSLALIALLIYGMYRYFGASGGLPGALIVLGLGSLLLVGMARGVFGKEFGLMLARRNIRTVCWIGGLACLAGVALFWKIDDCASGSFLIRPAAHVDVRAPMAGFLETVYVAEGERVLAGDLIAELKVTELDSRIAVGKSALAEAEAKTRDLKAGARPEEVELQQQKVKRLDELVADARQALARTNTALEAELAALDAKLKQYQHEIEYHQSVLDRWAKLQVKNAITRDQLDESQAKVRIAESGWEETKAKRRSLEARGAMEQQTQLATREKELGDARSELMLLQAGCRPEELQAAIANRDKLAEELRFLEQLAENRKIYAPQGGTIVTQRFRDMLGKYYPEGELICEIGDTSAIDLDIGLAEQDASRVEVGAPVTFKARTLPFHTFEATVTKIAPIGFKGEKETRTSVSIYCRVIDPTSELRPGTTGYARIHTGPRPVGAVILYRVLRFVRTEYWSLW